MKILLCLLLILNACSFKNKQLENQKLQGHEELYSEPEEPKLQKLETSEKRIVIAATNDLHGNYKTNSIAFTDDENKNEQTIQIGGSDTISQYFKILRDTYKNEVLLVDSGDIFSRSDAINETKKFYEQNRYDALTVGLRDFNLKVSSAATNNTAMFQEFAKNSKVPLILSNLHDLKTARVVEWEGVKSHLIKDINGVKVGIIGLVPDDIVAQTPVNNRLGLFVENMLQSTLRHARLMRSLGAEIIVVLTHQSIDCGIKQAEESKLPVSKVNFEPNRESVCNLQSVLGVYLERLPPHLVDVVVGGRNQHKIVNYVNGTLVLAAHPDGQSFNYVEFVVDTKTKKVVKEKTQVHQPVYFCNEFFKESKDCYYEDKSLDHKHRIPATFLGKEIVPEVNLNVKTSSMQSRLSGKELKQIMRNLDADISFIPETSGDTQMILTTVSGKELLKVLERDFNLGRKAHWLPDPFKINENELKISISGQNIDINRSYKILADLESLQGHRQLVAQINDMNSQSLVNLSWASVDSGNLMLLAVQKD